MKPAIIVGVLVFVAFVGVVYLGPSLASPERNQSREALVKAQQAANELARYDMSLPVLRDLADLSRMREGDLAPVIEGAREELEEISRRFNTERAKVQSRQQQDGLPTTAEPALNVSEDGLRRTAKYFDDLLKRNDDLLKRATSSAVDAAKATGTPGAPDVRGLVEYVRAATLMNEAAAIREQQQILETRLAMIVNEWIRLRAYADHYAGLEVSQILASFRRNLDEMSQQETEAAARVTELQGQVDALKGELATVDQRLADARAKLLQVENTGFEAGNDAQFNNYRAQYEDITSEMRELERREQELRYGSLRGAEFEGDDPSLDPIAGGEQQIGLETRERQLAIAQDKLERIKTGRASLEEQMRYVQESGQTSKRAKDDYDGDMNKLKAQATEIFEQLGELSAKAVEKENEALRAAQSSATAFQAAQQAMTTWLSEAERLQQEYDEKRQNLRLRRILDDPYARQGPPSAEAAARVLAGRIFAQRLRSTQSVGESLSALDKSGMLKEKFTYDPAPINAIADTARTEGLDTLEKARSIYDRIASDPRTGATAWVPKAALAGVHHLMAQLDATQVDSHISKALSLLNEAVRGQEQSPHVRPHVQFRDHLSGTGATTQPAAESTEPAEEETEG